jgi:hypothetical protein
MHDFNAVLTALPLGVTRAMQVVTVEIGTASP